MDTATLRIKTWIAGPKSGSCASNNAALLGKSGISGNNKHDFVGAHSYEVVRLRHGASETRANAGGASCGGFCISDQKSQNFY
jgi:hypothetical protein